MNNKFVIIDYGAGNLHSIENALEFLGVEYVISNDKDIIKSAKAIILPGVGAFNSAIEKLKERDLADVLTLEVVENKKPFLGICLGMQLLFNSSEENGHSEGLGWLKGEVIKIDFAKKLPHVGWNNLKVTNENSRILKNIDNEIDFYFDHSFHVKCKDEYISSKCEVSLGNFCVASVEHENIFATQFHPEKSQKYGLNILNSFIEYVGVTKC